VTITFSRAVEVEKIGRRLIARYHKDLLDNGEVRIDYVFRSEAAKSKGKVLLGRTRKVSGLNAFLTLGDDAPAGLPNDDTPSVEAFFVIEIAADLWALLTKDQKEALVDHELCHCRLEETETGSVVTTVAGHDVEEFRAVVERYGMWRPEIEQLVKAATGTQLSLDEELDGDQAPADPTDGDELKPRRARRA
jgi:hypothetical protein